MLGTGVANVMKIALEGMLSLPRRKSMYSPGGAISADGGICTVIVPLHTK